MFFSYYFFLYAILFSIQALGSSLFKFFMLYNNNDTESINCNYSSSFSICGSLLFIRIKRKLSKKTKYTCNCRFTYSLINNYLKL